MLRMEIALLLVLMFIAYIYFSTGWKATMLHTVFSMILVTMIVHLFFDGATLYTVNHMDTVPVYLNDLCHRFFLGSLILVLFLFYQYIAILVEEETGVRRKVDRVARIYLIVTELGALVLPIDYAITEQGNYSYGIVVKFCYLGAAFFLVLCSMLLVVNWKQINQRKRFAIGVAMFVEAACSLLQAFNPTWLISGMGLTLMTMAFYLTLENPEILRAELTEQKMSMLYLKSQINPHFLYNTLDTIRIQAQLNGDKEVAYLLMKLVSFFRLSVKVDRPMVTLADEFEMIEAYIELMCYRYPDIECIYDVDPELEDMVVPNFILQPLTENAFLHGLKSKGYKGTIRISCHTLADQPDRMEIAIEDSGNGFKEGAKAKVDEMLLHYDRKISKLEGNSIGLLNVQKRIKLLCGSEYGLWYTENPGGGATAHLLLPVLEEEV